jgi:peptidyl-prolyl cis-trans isomerase B (cyclophilin B)
VISLTVATGCGGGGNATKSNYESYEDVTFAEGEKPHVVIVTNHGQMELELWPDVAYIHCQNMVFLAETGFYDSVTFHRVVPGFVIQGGDPCGNGIGGPGYTIPAEFSDKPHIVGTLSMARSQDVNSAGSQFFVCLGRLTSLDGKYTVFGHLLEGYDVLHEIEMVPAERERPKEPVVMTRVYVVRQ